MLNKLVPALAFFVFLSTAATSATLQDVERSFFPFKNGAQKVSGIEPGMIINADNWQVAKDALDPAMLEFVKKGDYEIKVGETTSFELHPSYVEATKARLGKVKLGENVGEIYGADAGRPFPEEPSLDDPRAGEKLAWNFKYGYNWGDSAAIKPFYWKFRDMKSGKVERNLLFDFHFLNFSHRVNQEPIPELTPNPSDFFRGTYVKVLEPFEVKNTQLLIHRFEDDQKRDNVYLYLGFQRRVRRLSSGQVTDAFLGSDLMIEDFEGYNGRIADMNWKFLGAKYMLMPFYNHNDMPLDKETHKDDEGYQVVAFTGKGGCFPDITWQLRKVYEVEAPPVDPNHPLSKRVHYMDAQTFTIPRTNAYDRKGDLWKVFTIGQAHPDHHLPINKGSGVSLDDSFTMIDVQAQHCTTGQFKGIVDPGMSPEDLFTVQNMRATGK
jgi:hypothetical protein